MVSSPFAADQIVVEGEAELVQYGLDLESEIQLTEGNAKLVALHNSDEIPFLVARENIFTLNTHTFSQADFDEVGEVLLCPRPLGLLEIPDNWANTLRDHFLSPMGLDFNAPTRVTLQPYGDSGWVIHNYNQKTVHLDLRTAGMSSGVMEEKISRKQVEKLDGQVIMEIPARSRIWLEMK